MLGRNDEARISDDGRWVICQCRRIGYSATAVLLFPLEDPNRVVEIDTGRLKSGRRIGAFESTSRPARYAARLAIGTGLGRPMVGVPHQLAARGITLDGDTVTLGSVRWSSPDTALAVLDSTGLMVAKRPGIVRVMVTTGGWRTAWSDVVVRPRETSILLQEAWSNDLAENWRPFGVPRPRIESADGVRGLMNNGDGSFSSGVYSLRSTPPNGLAVDTWISTRLTANQWQMVNVSLENALTDSVLTTWDHGAGNMPRRTNDFPACSVEYPTTEGPAYGDSLVSVFDHVSSRQACRYPDRFGRVRGSTCDCRSSPTADGVAVNGIPSARAQLGTIPDSVERVVISGNSAATKVLVGPLTVRSGVPDDIDWAQLGKPIPAVPPPAWSPRR